MVGLNHRNVRKISRRGLDQNTQPSLQAVFLYCCPDCSANGIQMDWATSAIWAAMKKYSLSHNHNGHVQSPKLGSSVWFGDLHVVRKARCVSWHSIPLLGLGLMSLNNTQNLTQWFPKLAYQKVKGCQYIVLLSDYSGTIQLCLVTKLTLVQWSLN